MDNFVLELLIVPVQLTVLVSACLYFVSCLLIKIQTNLWTTRHSRMHSRTIHRNLNLRLLKYLELDSKLTQNCSHIIYEYFTQFSAENDMTSDDPSESVGSCVTVHMCPALVYLASKLNFLIQQDFQWINSLIWF